MGDVVMTEEEQLDERVLLTPLCGAHNEDPLCYLLQVDETRILLDCGWNDKFDTEMLEPLRNIMPLVDLVLVSFPDLEHMGALPYCMREFGMRENAAIYMTTPTKFLGLRYLYEAYLARASCGPFDAFDLDDVDEFEQRITEHPYDSPIQIGGKSVSTIVINALASGRQLGGAIWRIVREPDVVVYAVDYNHAKDSLLEGIFRHCEKLKPTLMITDSFNFLATSRDNYNRRREELCKRVLATLRKNRTVILPVDAAGRVLEILYVLNSYWRQNKCPYPLVWLTSVRSVIDIAQANLSYMNADIKSTFERTLRNPFEHLNHVQIVSSLEKVLDIRDPKVILASSNSLDTGNVQKLLMRYGPQEGNLVMLTDKTTYPTSIARSIYEYLNEHKTDYIPNPNFPIKMTMSEWVYKSGQELVRWKMQQKQKVLAEARRRQQEAENQAIQGEMAMDGMDIFAIIGGSGSGNAQAQNRELVDIQYNNGDERKTDGEQNATNNKAPPLLRYQSSFMMDDAARTGGGLYSVFQSTAANQTMFSVFEPERMKRWDEYGQIIDAEDYIYVEKGEDEKENEEDSDSDQSSAGVDDDREDTLESLLASGGIIEDGDGGKNGDKKSDQNKESRKRDNDEMDLDDDQDEDVEDTQIMKKKRRKKRKQAYNPLKDAMLPRDKRNNLPREVERHEFELTLRCAIGYIDMEGRSMGNDIRNLINIIKPRKVVVVHGSEKATAEMVSSCLQSAIQTVLAPKIGETVDVASDVGMWRVELDGGLFDPIYNPLFTSPKLVTSTKKKGGTSSSSSQSPTAQSGLAKVEKIGIRYVEGVVDMTTAQGETAIATTGAAQLPIVRPLPNDPSKQKLARTVEPQFVHLEVSKFEIFRKLEKYDADKPEEEKIKPEIVEGTIVCKDSVTVVVGSAGERVLVEGPVSATFYRVREQLYGCYIRV